MIKEDILKKSNPFSPSRLKATGGRDGWGICSSRKNVTPGKR